MKMIITLGDAVKKLIKELKTKKEKKGEKNDGHRIIS